MSKLSKRIGIWSTLACVALLAPSAGYAAVEFGKQGEPVKLVVGYQPYYTESWSGVVINGNVMTVTDSDGTALTFDKVN